MPSQDIVERIRTGQFNLSGPEWQSVSEQAKNLISGLLTVNASLRLTLDRVVTHPWLVHLAPRTPLQTSSCLGKAGATKKAVNNTFHAFYVAAQAGFTLGDPASAPLIKKRRKKRKQSPLPLVGDEGGRPSTLELVDGAPDSNEKSL